MSHWYILNDAGDPVPEPDLMKAARVFETQDRTVAKTQVGLALVSTVFLGFDHSYGDGPPILFETMVFWTGHEMHNDCARYPTRHAAIAGYAQMVAKVREAMTAR